MASWYRRFIPNFSSIASPLTNLLRKNKRFDWDSACGGAWSKIKNCLISAPVLSCPNFGKEFTIQTDASNYGIGAVLTQEYEDGEKVIAYLSRSLTRQERNFSTTEKECLAVLFAIERLRPYIEGSHFKVITDHASLVWLTSLQNPTGGLARWSVRMQQYNFTITHRPGKDHVVPDTLSRAVPIIDTISASCIASTDTWYNKLVNSVTEDPAKFPLFRLTEGVLYKLVRDRYVALAGEQSQWKVVVPKDRRVELISNCHDLPTSGHLGVYKTYQRLASTYFWPKMKTDVAKYVRRCVTCIKSKPEQKAPAGRMGGHSLISKPWEVISVDLIELPRSARGFKYALVVTDCFSKFTLCFPLRKSTATKIVHHLENDIFLVFGVPKRIISDNGVQFRSREYTNLLSSYGVRKSFTALYHPQSKPGRKDEPYFKNDA